MQTETLAWLSTELRAPQVAHSELRMKYQEAWGKQGSGARSPCGHFTGLPLPRWHDTAAESRFLKCLVVTVSVYRLESTQSVWWHLVRISVLHPHPKPLSFVGSFQTETLALLQTPLLSLNQPYL